MERSGDGLFNTAVTMRRARGIKNREQLNRLQARIEDSANGISELEKSKRRGAAVFAIIFGSLAALVTGGGMSLVLLNPASATLVFIGGVALAAAGAGLAALAYPIFSRSSRKKTAKVIPIIEKKKDELYNMCLEAHGLVTAI